MNAILWANGADEAAILVLVLQRAGFAVRQARKLDDVFQQYPEKPTDFIFLAAKEEILLKSVNQIRAISDVPIGVVLSPSAEEVIITLLDAGVDLLVERPYSSLKLIAQIKALMRRASGMQLYALPELVQQNVVLDPGSRMVTVPGQPKIRLTQLEFRLLYTLMIHPGQIIPTETLVEHVWGYSGQGDRDLVRGLIKRLRAKVEQDPHTPRIILNEPGVGYLFNNNLAEDFVRL